MSIPDRLALTCVRMIQFYRVFTIALFVRLFFTPKNNVNRILINRDGAFGDSLVALPALSIIRQNFPSTQIDLFCVNNEGVSFSSLPLQTGLIDNLYVSKKVNRLETLKLLKKNNYDLFIQLPQNLGLYKSLRNIFLVRFYLKIKNGFGWDAGRIKTFMRAQKKYLSVPNETERFIQSLQKNNLSGEKKYPLNDRVPENKTIRDIIDSDKSIVVFMIGGKLQPKKWPLHNWVSLAKMLDDHCTVLIVGGKTEAEEGEYISGKTENTINACGLLPIDELLYVLKKTNIVISLDTGARHLCDATETKQIVLFSTRDLTNKWFPNNANAVVIEKVLPCSFCLKTHCDDNICMKNITAEEVFSEVKHALE